MSRQAFVSVVTRNYLHYAQVLADSCRRWQPDACFFLVLADSLPATMAIPSGIGTLLSIEQLGISNWQRFAFQYTPFELSCALKPLAMQALIRQGFEQVVFLDADLALYAPLESITQALQSHSIALVPHLQQPLPRDGRKPSEGNFLNAGTFNGGLVACRNDQIGSEFLDWWQQHLARDCYVDLANGVFVDQKWLNLVPGLFPNVAIVRHPGCNAGHWTLSQFPLAGCRESGYRVGDQALECFHFSNFLPDNPYEFMRSQTRVSFSSSPALEQLVRDYHARLQQAGAEQYSSLGCQLNYLSDGTPIKPEWREAIRRDHKEFRSLADPFALSIDSTEVKRLENASQRAKKWRGDWRLQSPSHSPQKTNQKRWKNYYRYMFSRWRR